MDGSSEEKMISGKMYYHDEQDSLENKIQFLIRFYEIENISCVLVNNKLLNEEILIKNIKIKPDPIVLENHFWFIQENT